MKQIHFIKKSELCWAAVEDNRLEILSKKVIEKIISNIMEIAEAEFNVKKPSIMWAMLVINFKDEAEEAIFIAKYSSGMIIT